MLIDTFVNVIFLYDDKMVLTFNFKEGQKTITFDELNKQTKSRETGSDTELTGEHPGLSIMASLFVMSGSDQIFLVWTIRAQNLHKTV